MHGRSPLLDIVNYKQGNWLRCWFVGVGPDSVPIMQFRKLEDWARAMTEGFREHARFQERGGPGGSWNTAGPIGDYIRGTESSVVTLRF